MKNMLAVATVLAATCFGAPNFTGEWKLDLAKSKYGPIPPPVEVTRKVILDGAKLWMSTSQKSADKQGTSELRYTIDGKPNVNKLASGDATGTARWEGDSLIIDSSQQNGPQELKSHEVWTLSGDGKTLTIATHLTLPQGGIDVTQVFEKQ